MEPELPFFAWSRSRPKEVGAGSGTLANGHLEPEPPKKVAALQHCLPLHLTTSYHPSPQGCGISVDLDPHGSTFICPSGSGSRGLKNSTKM